jgi:hypothetical protein
MAAKLEFSWRSYCKPTPGNLRKVANSVLTGTLAAVPYVASLHIKEEIKYGVGAALGLFGLLCKIGVKFFSQIEDELNGVPAAPIVDEEPEATPTDTPNA